MNYEVFRDHNQGIFFENQEASPQEYMEKLFLAVLQPTEKGEDARISDMFQMSLVTCDEAKKELCLEIQPEAWTQNPYGMISGGILITAVDISMGLLVRFYKKTATVATVQLSMNYLRPVPVGETICISVNIDRLGTREVFLSANVVVKRTGKPVAIGTGIFV